MAFRWLASSPTALITHRYHSPERDNVKLKVQADAEPVGKLRDRDSEDPRDV